MPNANALKLDKKKIVEAFNKMDFGEAIESTNLADEWLKEENINLNDVKEESKYNSMDPKGFVDAISKYNFLNDIISDLKKNIQFLVELEMVVRGFNQRDALKSINLFLDCLSYYSTSKVYTSDEIFHWKIPHNISLSYIGYLIGKMDSFNNSHSFYVDKNLYVILCAVLSIIHGKCEKYSVGLSLYINSECDITKRTPVLVFNDADLDSACDSIVNAAFSEQGLMPWSVNTVLVQEDILSEVVMKLQHRLNHVKFGKANDKQADFSFPVLLGDYETKFKETLAIAKSKGIEVFQPQGLQGLTALFVGGKVHNNSAFTDKTSNNVPYLNVMAFRNYKEAVALCNNQQQTYAAGVWANDVGLVHDIIHSLNVTTVWINTHGVFHPSVPVWFDKQLYLDSYNNYSTFNEFKKVSKPAQQSWAKKSVEERVAILRKFAIAFSAKLTTKNDAVKQMIDQLFDAQLKASVNVYSNYELKQIVDPIGAVCIADSDLKANFEKCLISLLTGNAVLLILPHDVDPQCEQLYNELSGVHPGILQLTRKYAVNTVEQFYHLKNIWTAVGENYV